MLNSIISELSTAVRFFSSAISPEQRQLRIGTFFVAHATVHLRPLILMESKFLPQGINTNSIC